MLWAEGESKYREDLIFFQVYSALHPILVPRTPGITTCIAFSLYHSSFTMGTSIEMKSELGREGGSLLAGGDPQWGGTA